MDLTFFEVRDHSCHVMLVETVLLLQLLIAEWIL